MAPFDRPYATFYSSAIVSIALSCTISSYLALNNITLKSGSLKVIETGTVRKLGCGFLFAFYITGELLPIATFLISGRKSRTFYTHLYLSPPKGVTPSEFREDV